MSKTIFPGATIHVEATVRDSFSKLADPVKQTITLYSPEGEHRKTFETVKKETGKYGLSFTMPPDSEVGEWIFSWVAHLPGESAYKEFVFHVADIKPSGKVVMEAVTITCDVKLEAILGLTFLGTRGEIQDISQRSRNHSSFLLEYRGTKLLVEFGKGFTSQDLEKYSPDYVLVSHAHPDHAHGLLGLKNMKAQLLIPNHVSADLGKKKEFEIKNFKTFSQTINAGSFTIKPFKVWHSTVAPAHGFIITAGDKKIVYPGDVAWIPNMKEVLEGAWLYIGDASFFAGKSNVRKVGDILIGHAPMVAQLKWCKDARVKNVVFTHYGSWAFPPKNIRLGNETFNDLRSVSEYLTRTFNLSIQLAHDGRVFRTKTLRLESVHLNPYYKNEDLPAPLKHVLPAEAQTVWRLAYMAAAKQYKSEVIARKVAWTAVKKQYKKSADKWVKLEKTILPGRYLVEPHARLIWEGKKTLIISTVDDSKFLNKPVYFMEDQRVYGILKITKISGPFSADLVRSRLRHRHQITDIEWNIWAKKHPAWNEKVFVEEFDIVKKLVKPQYYEPAPGTERWVSAVELEASRYKCISCDQSPDVEVLWAEGHDHVWFYKKCFEEWKQKKNSMSKTGTNEGDICTVRPIKGQASKKWSAKHEEDMLPISSSGQEEGAEVTLSELLKHYNVPFFLKRPYIILTGGIVNRGSTKGDFDILINEAARIEERDRPTEFRIFRALPEELQARCSFHYLEFGGPFTSHMPLYDLMCVPSEWREAVRMEEMVEFFQDQVRMKELKEPSAIEQAQKARRTNQIEPMQFIIPAKPMIGHEPGQRYTLEAVASYVKQFPAYVQKKYDGNRMLIFKNGKDVLIRLYTGIDVTNKLPGTVKEVQSWEHPEVCTLDTDSEIWKEGKYIGREMLAAYLASKKEPNDDGVVHNCFDVLYFFDSKMEKHDLNTKIGDLHKEPYSTRLKYLALVPLKQSTMEVPSVKTHFNMAPWITVKTLIELKRAMNQVARHVASEGAVVKWDDGYPLTGACYKWAKYKKTEDIHAIVLKKLPTVTAGVSRYRVGIRIPPGWDVMRKGEVGGKEYMDIGKTGSAKKDLKEGQIVVVNYEELFYYIDPETQKRQLVAYVPQIVETRPEQTIADSAEELIMKAKARGLLVMKREALSYLSKFSKKVELDVG